MLILTTLHLLPSKNFPISSGYRPPWKLYNPSSPNDQHTGAVLLENKLSPNEICQALIKPLNPQYWQHLKCGDIIKAFEGSKEVITAEIKIIFAD